MEQKIRNRRLYAFFHSKVLNALMIAEIVSLLLLAYTKMMLLPAICGALALILFIGYALWLWIKKPRSIIVNNWLSEMNGYYTLYFLIVTAMYPQNQWWYIIPVALSMILLFIALITNHDRQFDI